MPIPIPEAVMTSLYIPDRSKPEIAQIIQLDKFIFSEVEHSEKTITVYVRGVNGGRVEFIIPDEDRKLQLVGQKRFDKNNQFTDSVTHIAIQADEAPFKRLKVHATKVGDLAKRFEGGNIYKTHLKRAGASDAQIQRVLQEKEQSDLEKREVHTKHVKLLIDSVTFVAEFTRIQDQFDKS